MFVALLLNQILTGLDTLKLKNPTRLMADGQYIDVTHGHATPIVADFSGKDSRDLLVGQFQDGRLRIYSNSSTKKGMEFKSFTWFQAGGTEGTVPFG